MRVAFPTLACKYNKKFPDCWRLGLTTLSGRVKEYTTEVVRTITEENLERTILFERLGFTIKLHLPLCHLSTIPLIYTAS